MTRTEFDAAFKLALGYVISEKHYQWYDNGATQSRCIFKNTGISFIFGNRRKFINYEKIIDFIPHIKRQINTIDVSDKIISIDGHIFMVLER